MNANTEVKYEIILTDKYAAVKSGKPIFEDALFSCINFILNNAIEIVNHFTKLDEEHKDDPDYTAKADIAKGEVFDMMNLAFSNALHAFDPEVDLHPELDPKEMLAKENKRLDEALANNDQVTFAELMKGDANSYEEIQGVSEMPRIAEESD